MEVDKKIELKIISKKELAMTLGNKQELYYFFEDEGKKKKNSLKYFDLFFILKDNFTYPVILNALLIF